MVELIQRSDLLDMVPVVIHTHKLIKMFTSLLPWLCDRHNVLQRGA